MTLYNKRHLRNGIVVYREENVKESIKELKQKVDAAQKDFGTLEVVDKEKVQNLIKEVFGDVFCGLDEVKNE